MWQHVSSTMAAEIVSRIVEIPPVLDAGTQIPITTIRGSHPGPVLALIAGNHGYEYPPILALQKLRSQIDAAKGCGTSVMADVANMPSFLGRKVYFSPIDGKNLNRVYPGRKDGTVSERIAYAITNEVIDKADYVLDLHCGDGNEWLRPYVYQTVTGNQDLDQATARLALAFVIDHIVLDRSRPLDPTRSTYCSNTAITRGKPAITAESGFLGTTDAKSVERIVAGVLGVLRELKMTEDGPAPLAHPVYLDPADVIASPETGIFWPQVVPGQTLKKGTRLPLITH